MPFYDLRCDECGEEHNNIFLKIADLDIVECDRCEVNLRVLIRPIALDLFPAQWMEHIDNEPQYVESKKQLRDICAKNDLTCFYSVDGERGPHVKEV